ncbi:SIR2 family protein [Ferrovibrio terrae]|uniref:SIR2 family protein n=1 Tax=Ferrovibrio terrae TaxID=2594003 RepID=UPI0031380831
MNRALLIGAGFSYNWGGPLASDLFSRLLGSPELTDGDLILLRKYPQNFEDTLAVLQMEFMKSGKTSLTPQLERMQNALKRIFDELNADFSTATFEFQKPIFREYSLSQFLAYFNTIFSLNQDLLLEYHYLNGNVELSGQGWSGWVLPGMKRAREVASPLVSEAARYMWAAEDVPYKLDGKVQPLIKLHGSSNWIDAKNNSLMIMGGYKDRAIAAHSVLKQHLETFRSEISKPNTHLMIIGYGFNDNHINNALFDAAKTGNLKLFIVDPAGIAVLNRQNQGAAIPAKSQTAQILEPCVFGLSNRALSFTFGSNGKPELRQLMSFIGKQIT